MKRTKNLCLIVLCAFYLFPLFGQKNVEANTALPFGGLVTFTLPCTCSGALWIWFTPLWLGNIPGSGPLVYVPYSSLLYQGYMIGVPGAWHLGEYAPGVQACFQVTPVGCIPQPAIGVITQTGTSVPGLW